MITNERQRRITQAQARRFEIALEDLQVDPARATDVNPLLRSAERAALESQLDDLRRELAEYDALRSGRRPSPPPDTLDELPRALIQARIAAGLTQRQLAEDLGLKEQQIQRYEATEYAAASLERVREVARRLGVRMRSTPARALSR